jgi:hypothetical protein
MKPHPTPNHLRLLGAITIAVSAVTVSYADYKSTLLAHNPLAYWQFDGTAASPPLNLVTNYGSVGSAGNGVVVRACDKAQPGAVNSSMNFNNLGSGSIDCLAKVDVPYTAGLNPAGAFTVEFWAWPRRNDSTLCAVSSMDCQLNGGGGRTGWLFYQDTTRWLMRLGTSSGYLITSACSTGLGSVALSTWQHVVGTFDGTTAKIYLNGVLKATVTQNSPAGTPNLSVWTPNTEMPIMFGAFALDGAGGNSIDGPANSIGGIAGYRGFDGYLDEIAIYSNVLSAATILAHYNAASTPATYGTTILADQPLGYWNFDEPAVTAPAPATLPTVTNIGTEGSAVNGTNSWGCMAAQSGPGYGGMGGASDKACYFDGDNGYIGLLDDPGMHFTNGAGLITMMAWVKPMGSINYYRNIIAHGWDGNYQETFLRIAQGDGGTGGSDGTNYYQVGVCPDGTESGYNNNVAMFPIPPGDVGNWVFVAGTYDGSAWNLYRNGQLVASTPSANGAFDATNRWSIGSRTGPSPTTGYASATFESEGLFFNGYIDEPAILTNALLGIDIMGLYNAAQVPPIITRAVKVPPGIFKGSTASFNVWADGNATLSYLWRSNGVSTGVTGTNYTISALAAGSLTVSVEVNNSYGSATSSVSTVIFASKPLILQQPVALTRYVGRPFSFSVVAGGTSPIGYQWYTNGIPISGATGATYSGTVSATTAGSYSCILSNEAGTSNSISVALVALPIPSGYGGTVIADGPVAFYRLNETSGTACHDYYGGNDGSYNSVTLNQLGYSTIDPDPAVLFAGGLNSYAGGISGTAINFPGHSTFTLECWAKGPSGQGDQSTLIAKGIGPLNTTRTEQFALDVSGGNYRFFTTGGNTVYEADTTVGPNGTWQHIVAVYDDQNVLGGGSNMYLYVNGELRGQQKTRPAGVNGTTSPVSIGSKRTGNDPNYDGGFAGEIDEVAIYPYAMSATTIAAHYSAAYGPSLPPIISIEPSPVTNYAGLAATFFTGVGGTQPLTYQWKRGGAPLSDGPTGNGNSFITGSSTEGLSISNLAVADAGDYTATITNVNGTTNTLIAHLTVLTAPVTAPSIPGLVVHLPMNGNLSDVTGRGNNAVGIHIVKNHGVVTSNTVAPTFVPDGPYGSQQGFHFATIDDGSNTNFDNTYATFGTVRPDLQFATNGNFSVALWIRPPVNYIGNDLPYFGNGVGSTFATPGIVFAYTYGTTVGSAQGWAGGWAYSVLDSAVNGLGGRGEIGSINDGNWHHLVHVFDRQNNKQSTYLDGLPVQFHKQQGTSLSLMGSTDSGSPFAIGQDPTGLYASATAVPPPNPTTASGDIADLGVFKHALTPLEAASLFVAAQTNHLSFVGSGNPTLTVQRSGNNLILTWSSGMLQSATSVSGPYVDVPTATSPYTFSPTATKVFYRVRLL